MMQEYLLDTNILIYLLEGKPEVIRPLKALRREYFFVSTLTSFEFLTGAKNEKEEQEIKERLGKLVPLDLRTDVVYAAKQLQKNQTAKIKFKDLLIAATAQVEGLTLVTADKDFQNLKGLKVKLLSV